MYQSRFPSWSFWLPDEDARGIVWTKHLRFENTERGRESESNRGAFGSQRVSLLKPQGPLRNPDKEVHTKVSSRMHSRSQKWEQSKRPARGVNKLWSTHTAAACCMGNKNGLYQRPIKLTFFFKGWKKKVGDFVRKREEKKTWRKYFWMPRVVFTAVRIIARFVFSFRFSILSKYEMSTPCFLSRGEGRRDKDYFTQVEPYGAAKPFVLPCILQVSPRGTDSGPSLLPRLDPWRGHCSLGDIILLSGG